MDQDTSQSIQEQVQQARASNMPLRIVGSDSKAFYGQSTTDGQRLSVGEHQGIISYEPTELVIKARAGTPLQDIEQHLAQANQMLAFEPPAYAQSATLGGTIACNFSGPRRAFAGSARDFVLGCTLINGQGERLHFGGEVMKNVAGYDVARLMCGAMGTLGVLLDISIKVLPKPETEITLVYELDANESLTKVHEQARQSLPISATCFDANRLYVRLSGTEQAVSSARNRLGGEVEENGQQFWHDLKEHQLSFFNSNKPLWRLSLASNAPLLKLSGKGLYEWNGALRWLLSDETEQAIRNQVERHGGHAICFKNANADTQIFHTLAPPIQQLHKNLKHAFDPDGILNPKRMYADW